MDGLFVILTALLGVVSCSHDAVSVSVEFTAKPGDNIILYCDCKVSTGVYIVWFRNCSHENQPSLVLHVKDHFSSSESAQQFPRLTFEKNISSDSYDLVIMNTTKSDEGLYYCGTEETMVNSKGTFEVYRHGSITTRLRLDPEMTLLDGGLCRKLLFSLVPAASIFFTFLSLFVAYLLSKKTAKIDDEKKDDTEGQTEEQAGDRVYAALEIPESSQRPKKKKTQRSDFGTYSTVKYTSS